MTRPSSTPHSERPPAPSETRDLSLLPPSSEALISSTVSPGDGILARLHNRFSWLGIEDPQDRDKGIDPEHRRTVASHIHELIMELEERIRRYLIQETEHEGKTVSSPSPYAELLTQTIRNLNAATPTTKRGLSQLSSTVIAEITPILRNLSAYIHEHATPLLPEMQSIQALDSPSGLLNFLKVANVQANDTYTLFGALDHLSSRIAGFPRLDLKEKELPNRLVVQDPLASSTVSYWREKRRFNRQTYGVDMSRPALIASQSVTAYNAVVEQQAVRLEKEIGEIQGKAEELRKKVEGIEIAPPDGQTQNQRQAEVATLHEELATLHAQIEHAQTLQGHYYNLGSWIADRTQAIAGVSESRLSDHVSSLTFAWGDDKEIFGIFNALEAVKRHDPELYARLLGIRAGRTSKESVRSDLYGNVLHIALARTLHQAATSDRPESAALRARLDSLFTLDARPAPLVLASEDEWEFLEKTLESQEQGEVEEKGDKIAKALMMVGISPESYVLRKLFESPDVAEREKIMTQLRQATPVEFIRLIKQVTRKNKPVPEDVKAVFEQRGLTGQNIELHGDLSRLALPSPKNPDEIFETIHIFSSRNPAEGMLPSCYQTFADLLWRTTPSERLLEGQEFFAYLELKVGEIKNSNDAIEKLNRSVEVQRNKKNDLEKINYMEAEIVKHRRRISEIALQVPPILDAHPDITQEQWLVWWERSSGIGDIEASFSERIKTIRTILRQFTPQQVAESKSQIFVLFSQVVSLFSGSRMDTPGGMQFSFEQAFGKEAVHAFEAETPENLLLKYKVLYRMLPAKDFFTRNYINESFYKSHPQDYVQSMDINGQTVFLHNLFKCLSDEKPYRNMQDAPIEWMRDLLNLAERTIPHDENYRRLASEPHSSMEMIVNKKSYMCNGVARAYWELREIGEYNDSPQHKYKRLEGRTLRKRDGTWEIVTSDNILYEI